MLLSKHVDIQVYPEQISKDLESIIAKIEELEKNLGLIENLNNEGLKTGYSSKEYSSNSSKNFESLLKVLPHALGVITGLGVFTYLTAITLQDPSLSVKYKALYTGFNCFAGFAGYLGVYSFVSSFRSKL
ncbi:hypothetical protein J7L02_00780 [Candidatus Woesearchaeota archaeon]|nr:hypothetical protein [Candidatus Woesearchaeota archaeon]